ncbi:MAG TPA: DUF1648 domain-containing protein [Blastocatellia bacterium]|nr:DUF1648 domain-containing protein [Blastocatellia bacterium]
METPGVLQVFLVLAAGIQSIYYYRILPPIVAAHFSGSGVADGWWPKPYFLLLYWVLIGSALAVSAGVGAYAGRTPESRFRIPNKEYWLAAPRREQTVSFLRMHFRWLGVLLLVFQISVFQLIFSADLSAKPSLDSSFLIVLVAFGVLIVVWGRRFTSKFSRID